MCFRLFLPGPSGEGLTVTGDSVSVEPWLLSDDLEGDCVGVSPFGCPDECPLKKDKEEKGIPMCVDAAFGKILKKEKGKTVCVDPDDVSDLMDEDRFISVCCCPSGLEKYRPVCYSSMKDDAPNVISVFLYQLPTAKPLSVFR
jgi:hypothetical protein